MTTRRSRRRQDAVPLVNQIEILALDDIHPYQDNPRDNDPAVESVANSIRTFGFVVPILIDDQNVIVAGHTRYLASVDLGLDEAPTIRASHLTEDQIRQFRIIDNKVSELARWDFDVLAAELTALQESGLEWTQYGFNQEELDCLQDVVASDCLAVGAASEMEGQERTTRASRISNERTRCVVGEFVWFIPTSVYREWSTQLRNDCDYDDENIDRTLKDRLGMTEYE